VVAWESPAPCAARRPHCAGRRSSSRSLEANPSTSPLVDAILLDLEPQRLTVEAELPGDRGDGFASRADQRDRVTVNSVG
jgi:hypothetical protein